jgi:hypothetical protein
MPDKPKRPPDDQQQSKRLAETAPEIATDESRGPFNRAFRKVASKRKKPDG